jgi:hypothetical protein
MFCSLGLVGRTREGLIPIARIEGDDEGARWAFAELLERFKPAKGSAKEMGSNAVVSVSRIERKILVVRGQKVMLDADLAELYGVTTGALNQAVKRNLDRFPEDFMFQLSAEERESLVSQSVIPNARGGNRFRPYAFTEQGVAMLSSVLRSERAVRVNVEIMRTFVRLRELLVSHADLAAKLDALEQKYDGQFAVVFQALRGLMVEKGRRQSPIGYLTEAKPSKRRR